MNAKIYLSKTGEYLGTVEEFDDTRYANACDNEEGHVRAGDVLGDSDIQALNLTGDETVYALTA